MIALQDKPAINYKAIAGTAAVHILLLLLFFLPRYTVPVTAAPADGGGLEVNLGSSDNGSGSNQPMSQKDPGQYQASVVYKQAAEKENLPENMLRSQSADAPVVNTPVEKKKNNSPENNDTHRQPQPQAKNVYQGATGNAGGNNATQNKNGTSEGITTGPGDQGMAGGTPGARNYTGIPGDGTGGISHTLTGREITPRTFEAEFHEGGRVVMHVTVDRNGNITKMEVKSTSGPELTRLAKDKLRNAHFSKSADAAPEQFGDITLVFKTR